MSDTTYLKRLDLPDVDAATLFRWHARPGAFARLVPPWENVTLEGPAAPLVPGMEQTMVLRLGPARVRWRARIESVEEGASFQDVQLSGPFRRWRHTHSMIAQGEERSTLEDRVEYALPLPPFGALVAGRSVKRKLARMFGYRHRITVDDLARHAPHAGREPLDVLVTGASGMVGSALCAFLSTGGHRVRRLTRGRPRDADTFRWDPVEGTFDPAAFEGADAVVHLAGENIAARRWTRVQKNELRTSRVRGTQLVCDAIRAAEDRPRVLVAASAVGFYGHDRGDEVLDETSATGTGFLAEVCRDWEEPVERLAAARTVRLRFGVVLSPAGGALRKMLPPFLLGGGGRLGDGRQWMSWVALDDVVGAIHHALLDRGLEGVANVTAPNPVTNREYTATLGRVLRRPTVVPLPGFVARAAFGELADELLLGGQRVQPRALEAAGFSFRYPELEGALRHQLGRMA